ncbi:hypothetical protein BLNAU_23588 [Blattamonas nauphoetae]|uniref:Uncharacterized protein n=1 Tax=Blattamonas nauphoetae TaxID=2049346 RepID=A0ABQ9WU03_9EUKA|nr:hypothetical protein BLNAU_23588 [Blattamonas nauphoetae]
MGNILNKIANSWSQARSALSPPRFPFSVDCSPFLNWNGNRFETAVEKTVVFQSLVATVKLQPTFDVSVERKAVKFLESVNSKHPELTDDFLCNYGCSTEESLANFVESIVVLLSSPSQPITSAAMKMLGNLIFSCSANVKLALVTADLITQIILTLNPLTLSFTEADNTFQFVAPCLIDPPQNRRFCGGTMITWESIFRYALRLDVTDFSNPVVKLNLRFGDICPLIKKAYEQDTSPIDDSPPPPLAPLFEDMESEDGHFDNSKIEQSVKTAMGNADVGAYTSLSSHSPAIQSGIFYTPNAGHLIKPENVIVLTEGQCLGKIDVLHQPDQGEEPGKGCALWRTPCEAAAPDVAYP